MDDTVDQPELDINEIANVAAIMGLLQGELSAAHFPHQSLAELQAIGVLEDDYAENVVTFFEFANKEMGTNILLSVMQSLFACRIFTFDSERFGEIFEPTEGSHLQ